MEAEARAPFWASRPRLYALAGAVAALATGYALVLFEAPGLIESLFRACGVRSAVWQTISLPLFGASVWAVSRWYQWAWPRVRMSATAAVLAACVTAAQITGMSFANHLTACAWTSCSPSGGWLALAANCSPVAAAGFFTMFYTASAQLTGFADSLVSRSDRARGAAGGPVAWLSAKVSPRPFALAAAVIAIAWLPYVVVFFPGAYAFDGARQLNEFIGVIPATTHHPPLATGAMGALFALGRPLGVAAALFLYTSVQIVASVLVFALTTWRVRQLVTNAFGWRPGVMAWTATVAFFALNPAFAAGPLVVFKDWPYMLGVLLLINVLVEAATQRALSPAWLVALVASFGCVAALRNDGIVIALVAAGALSWLLAPDQRRAAVAAAGAVTAAVWLANAVLLPRLGVERYSNAEALSVPLQQTARFLRDHPEAVTPAERETLQSLLKDGHELSELAANYAADVSDPVKNRFKSMDREGLTSYLRVWAAMGARDPGAYVEATAAGVIQYFHPASKKMIPPVQYLYLTHRPGGDYLAELKSEFGTPDGLLDPAYPQALAGARAGAVRSLAALQRAPGLHVVWSPAPYTWVLLICLALLVRGRRWRALAALTPLALVLLVSLASPLNGSLRYALPYVAAAPLTVACCASALSVPSRTILRQTGRAPEEGSAPRRQSLV